MVVFLKNVAEFDEAIKKPKVVLDFTATWCPPCKRIAPVFEKLAKDNPEIEFYKVDVDDAADVAEKCEIQSMPTFKFFHNGECVKTFSGASEEQLQNSLDELKAKWNATCLVHYYVKKHYWKLMLNVLYVCSTVKRGNFDRWGNFDRSVLILKKC